MSGKYREQNLSSAESQEKLHSSRLKRANRTNEIGACLSGRLEGPGPPVGAPAAWKSRVIFDRLARASLTLFMDRARPARYLHPKIRRRRSQDATVSHLRCSDLSASARAGSSSFESFFELTLCVSDFLFFFPRSLLC